MSPTTKYLLALLITTAIPFAAPLFTDGPLTTAPNLKVRTNENGYLRLSAGTGVTDGPLTNFGNIKLRTNENGYFRISCDDCGGAVSDAAYNAATWNDDLGAASKNAIRDKIEAIVAGGGLGTNDIDTSAELASILTDELGSGKVIFSAGTLAITAAKTLTVSGSMTQTVTDGSTVAFGTGGTVLYSGGALGTPSSGTLTNATGLPFSTGLTVTDDDKVLVSTGSAWEAKAIADCDDTGGNHLNYDTTTNAFACGTSGGGGGGSVSDTAYDATSWDAVTTVAPSKNAIRDLIESFCTIADPGGHRLIGWDDTDNSCAAFTIGAGLTYTHGSHTIAADVTLDNAVTITGKTISGSANTLLVDGTSQISGNIPVTNLVTATNRDNTHFLRGDGAWIAIAGGGDALVANPLSQFASTTSAELAGVISNETGTSLLVYNTSPTLVTPLITGNRWNFAAKTADYTVGGTDSILSCNAAGTSVTVTFTLPTAASVSGKAYTFVRIDSDADGACVLDGNSSETVDGAATLSMPFGTATSIASDGTNWVVTGSSGQALSDPGANKLVYWNDTASKIDFSPVTISSAGVIAGITGAAFNGSTNAGTFTLSQNMIFNAGNCQNATASVGFDLPSTVAATAGCVSAAGGAGDPAYGYALFPSGGADTEIHGHFPLPSDWTGAVDLKLTWNSASATANDVVWEVSFGCIAAGSTEVSTGISYNDTAFTAVTNLTSTGAFNTASKTSITTTGCAASETAFFIIHRDTDTSGDTLDQDVRLIDATFVIRRAIVAG